MHAAGDALHVLQARDASELCCVQFQCYPFGPALDMDILQRTAAFAVHDFCILKFVDALYRAH